MALSQEQSGKSSIPNRWRYSFNETWPVRSLASWATSLLLVMVLYILELSLTLHLAVIFLSIFESVLLFLQDVFQSVLVACLIQLDLDVLRGGCCIVVYTTVTRRNKLVPVVKRYFVITVVIEYLAPIHHLQNYGHIGLVARGWKI